MDYQLEERRKKDIIQKDGVDFVEISISYPFIEMRECKQKYRRKIDSINTFYKQISESCQNYAKTALLSAAQAEYEREQSPRKRFFFRRFIYCIKHKITFSSPEILSIKLDIFLNRGGKRLFFYSNAQTWNVKKGRLAPAWRFAKLNNEAKKLLSKKKGDFCVEKDNVVFFSPHSESLAKSLITLPRIGSEN